MGRAAYFHIPFCEKICHYCDFNKVFLENQPVDEYVEAMAVEMENTVTRFQKSKLKTAFVGGGTPTALNLEQLERFLQAVHSSFTFEREYEFTFEANPGNLDLEKLKLLNANGVNRLSIGVQAFQNELLEVIGRDHKEEHIYKLIEEARSVGFENISIDLMFGLPKQTVSMFAESIKEAVDLGIDHVSAYSLQVEPKTVFYNQKRRGQLVLPTEEAEAEMFDLLISEMKANGFQHYEISNFAKKGKKSDHNLTYWNNEEYYGIGAGAHSYLNGVRRKNAGPLQHYMSLILGQGHSFVEENKLSEVEMIEEEIFLGLRKSDGVSKQKFYEKYARTIDELYGPVLSDLSERSLLENDENSIRLTNTGLFLGNEVFEAFLIDSKD